MNDLPSLLVAARGPRTIVSVANASGVSARTIQKAERGHVPTLTSLVRLLDALGVGVGQRRAILDAHMVATAAAVRA